MCDEVDPVAFFESVVGEKFGEVTPAYTAGSYDPVRGRSGSSFCILDVKAERDNVFGILRVV